MLSLIFTLLLSPWGEANSCAIDREKFCSHVEPGKGQLARCLEGHKTELTSECRKELADFTTKSKKKNACFQELSEFCADIPSSAAKLEICLLRHESRLGADCAKDFQNNKGKILVKNVCAQDIVNVCYGELKLPEGAATRCLFKNKDKVSKNCALKIEKQIAQMKKKNPCFEDTEKFCPKDLHPVDIEICLGKKLQNLAPQCKKRVEKELAKSQKEPCYQDLKRHCKRGIAPSDQARCLDLNFEHLSQKCQQHHTVRKEKTKKMVELCEADRLKFCPKEPAKNGRIAKCLIKNKTKISKACAELLQ